MLHSFLIRTAAGRRLGDEGEGAVGIHRNDHGDDHTHVVLGTLIKLLGKGGNVDTMLAQGTDRQGARELPCLRESAILHNQ